MNVVTLAIQLEKDPNTGEMRVPEDAMDLLTRFSAHRDVCDMCASAFWKKTGLYCATGRILFEEIVALPCCQVVPES